MDVRLGKRAQLVIPAALRRQMGISDGDLLHAEIDEHGRLVLERIETDPVDRLAAAGAGLWSDVDAVDHQRALRDEWPA